MELEMWTQSGVMCGWDQGVYDIRYGIERFQRKYILESE